MSARHVADLLAVAHAGQARARETGDRDLLRNSRRLAVLALEHADAGKFFAGLQQALAASYDDPQPDEELPESDSIEDGEVDTTSPVDAGALPHDGVVSLESEDENVNRPVAESASAATSRKSSLTDDVRRALENLR